MRGGRGLFRIPLRVARGEILNGLVITADDFGLATEVNEAVEFAHRKGVLTAASLMVTGNAVARAVALAKRLPGLRIGLHLTFLEDKPAAPPQEIPDLVDSRGCLRRDKLRLALALAMRPSVRRQLRREIAAQFSAFRRTGLPLDHVNAHGHFHVHPMLAGEVVAACLDYAAVALRVPHEPASIVARIEGAASPQAHIAAWTGMLRSRARRARLLTPDTVFGLRWTGQMTAPRLGGLIEHLPEGLNEIYTHPATADAFSGHAPGYRYTQELAALTDPEVIKSLRRCGHHAGGYSDFIGAPRTRLAEAS
jgi:hopanoid biosynthesis associated protein HpnK